MAFPRLSNNSNESEILSTRPLQQQEQLHSVQDTSSTSNDSTSLHSLKLRHAASWRVGGLSDSAA